MHRYLSVEEVAKIACAPVASVRRWIRTGRLPSVKSGRRRLIRRGDVERWLKRPATGGTRAPSRRGLVVLLLAQLDAHARFLRRTLLLLSSDAQWEAFKGSERDDFERRIRQLLEARFDARIRRSLARGGFQRGNARRG